MAFRVQKIFGAFEKRAPDVTVEYFHCIIFFSTSAAVQCVHDLGHVQRRVRGAGRAPLSASFPNGTDNSHDPFDSVHYKDSVFKPAEEILLEYF